MGFHAVNSYDVWYTELNSLRCGHIPYISINRIYGLEEDGKWSPVAFKMSNPFWEGCGVLKRAVPHGHNGKAVFEIKISHCGKVSDIF